MLNLFVLKLYTANLGCKGIDCHQTCLLSASPPVRCGPTISPPDLSPHRPYDCAIDLLSGSTPSRGRLYSLSAPERRAMEEYISDVLAAGIIHPSSSPAEAGFFVRKKDGSLRCALDYRGLNDITVQNRYPLPLLSSAFELLQGGTVFTKLDLRNTYHLVWIWEGDKWKTAFNTPTGHYEYLVMPFGLTNMPAVFQGLVNNVLRDMLNRFPTFRQPTRTLCSPARLTDLPAHDNALLSTPDSLTCLPTTMLCSLARFSNLPPAHNYAPPSSPGSPTRHQLLTKRALLTCGTTSSSTPGCRLLIFSFTPQSLNKNSLLYVTLVVLSDLFRVLTCIPKL
ncbi:hypothetical protein ACEWY4_021541 [Coilia grayii]|uniref:ribonuclease H n=1 Tax=Coilia grayii TaxID=363190 RepID=A0ABD1J9B7_9TELE